MRVLVARGSMPYSAVTQPFPELRRNGGTRSSTLAVQMTLVLPALMSTDPSAWIVYSGISVVSRSSSAGRLSDRMTVSLLDPREIFRERSPKIDVTRQRLDRFAVHEHLHAAHRRQVHGEGVDDGVDGEELVDGAAGVGRARFTAEIDIRIAGLGDEHRAQRRAGRNRGDQRLDDRRDLRGDDLARLIVRAVAVRDVALHAGQPRAVVGDIEQPRLDLASRRRRHGGRRGGRPRRRAPAEGRQPALDEEHGGGEYDDDGNRPADRHAAPHQRVPPDGSASWNFTIASNSACTIVF